MADKIDYKAYLAQLGKVETDSKARLKEYLEKQIEEDDALRSLYRPEKLDDCYDFITNAVKEMPRNGMCAFVDDAVVFKMARDYFLEVLPKVAENAPEVKTQLEEAAVSDQDSKGGEESVENSEAETEPETQEELPADNENEAEEVAQPDKSATMDNEGPKADDKGTVTDEYGFEVFGEEGAETAEEAETEAETEPETQEELPADNENSDTPCGEAEPENEKPDDSVIKYDEEGNGLLFGF